MPYSEYVKVVAPAYFEKWFKEGRFLLLVVNASLLATVRQLERQFADEFGRILGPVASTRSRSTAAERLARFGVTTRHAGESLENILKLLRILEEDPGVRLFVQASPAFCCPSLVTEAMAARIEAVTGVPIVSITYDGTAAPRNDVIVPHLHRARREAADRLSAASTGLAVSPTRSSPRPRWRGHRDAGSSAPR
jgi:hypothetical protein